MNGLDYIVTQGKDYTIGKHIKQQFAKVGHTPSAKEIADVIQCNFALSLNGFRAHLGPKSGVLLVFKS